jgi:branched-chain amino acid transport system permease protein
LGVGGAAISVNGDRARLAPNGLREEPRLSNVEGAASQMTEVVAIRAQRLSSTLRAGGLAALVALGFVVVGIAIPNAVGSKLLMTLLVQATINGILALSVGTLFRLNGVITFGQAAFYGLAAYIVALGLTKAQIAPELAIALALIVPTCLAFVLGLGIVGIPGVAFAMLTLAVGQALYELAMKARSLTNGEDGFDIAFPNRMFGVHSALFQQPESMFVICWVILVLIVLSLSIFTRTKFGRLALAIRENEERARFIGYTTRVHRAAVFALSAFIAAIAGILLVLYNAYISPDILSAGVSGSALVMAIMGGPQLVWGPALGAMLFFFLKDIVGDFTEHWQAMIGLTLIVVTVLLPQGIGDLLHRRIVSLGKRRSS